MLNYDWPVSDNFQFFQNEKNAAIDEELFIGFQRIVQLQQIALFHSTDDVTKLEEIISEKWRIYNWIYW